MKKLLAIAIAAAITVPMAAMADTTVYGKGHMSVGKTTGAGGFVESHSSRIGLKGSNALNNGLTATHQFEIGYNYLDQDGDLTPRDSWIGLKGRFGEFRVGRQTTPYSLVHGATAFTTRNDNALHTFTRAPNALAYINKFGAVGVAAAIVVNGSDGAFPGDDDASKAVNGKGHIKNLLVNYSAGPLYAGVAFQSMPSGTGKNGTKLALAYKGANYGVGLHYEKLPVSGDKVTTVAGQYSFGRAYLAAQYGKNKDADLKQKTIELGYGLGKGTKVYYEWESLDEIKNNVKENKKSNRIGLEHSF